MSKKQIHLKLEKKVVHNWEEVVNCILRGTAKSVFYTKDEDSISFEIGIDDTDFPTHIELKSDGTWTII